MDSEILTQELYQSMITVAVLSGPPLIVASALGLLIAILQAVTQIQDQSFPQIIKLIVVAISLAMFGGVLTIPLVQHADKLFTEFYLME